MIWLITWVIYGLMVGALARWLHPGKESITYFQTLLVGIVGSYVGGFLSYLLLDIGTPFSPSGIGFSLLGAIIVLIIYMRSKNK